MRRALTRRLLVAVGVGLALVTGALGGPVLAVMVVGAALLLAVDLQGLLRRAGVRPLLPAALPLVVGGPWLVLAEREEALSVLAVAGFALAVLAAFLIGPGKGAAHGLGATLIVGLLPGLGAAGLLLIARDAGGVLVLVAAVAGAEAAAALLAPRVSRARRASPRAPSLGRVLTASAVGAVVLAVGAHVVSDSGLMGEAVAAFAALAVLGTLAARSLRAALGRPDDVVAGVPSVLATAVALVSPVSVVLFGAIG